MKKILIVLIICLLLFLTYTVVFNGIEVAGFIINSYEEIENMNSDLNSRLVEASKLTSIDFPERMSGLDSAAKKLTVAKEKYEDKMAYSSEEEIRLAKQNKI